MDAMQLKNQALSLARLTNRPLFIWGPPGVGKSSILASYCAENDLELLDFRLVYRDAVDLRGLPDADKKAQLTRWLPPAELPREGKGILFLDEIAQARVEVKNAATQLVLEGRIGEYVLPKGWSIVAASNRIEDNAGTSMMPKQVANRFWHVTLSCSHDAWNHWALEQSIDERIVAYLKYRPESLFAFDPRSKDPAFASPRSWHYASDLLRTLSTAPEGNALHALDSALLTEIIGGAVSLPIAGEFIGFLRIMESLISVEQVIASPKKVPVPSDPSVLYALTLALGARARREWLDALFAFVERMPEEFAVLFAKRLEAKHPELLKSKQYVAFAIQHQDSL